MKRQMLINAQRAQELRIAIVSGGVLDAYQVAVAEAGLTRGNIYRGVVAGVQPALDAAFVDFGLPKHGFLSSDDVVSEARHRQPPEGKRPRIDAILERGRPIVVQVTKDPTGAKGAALTTNLSLAGRYLVLMPYDQVRGISRKVEDEEIRAEMRTLAAKLTVPEGCGFILRTAALDQTKTALDRDLAALLRLWKKVRTQAGKGKGPQLLYIDQDLIVQAVRDSLDASIDEVLVDDDDAFEKAQAAMQAFTPRSKTVLSRYRERVPLFSRYGIEEQIESIFKRSVPLPSGGSIVIDPTEALTAIDVNSGRATRAASHEDTYLTTNLEAASEVARQLRLRDIGGLIVVDFIDMRARKHDKEVEKALRDAVKVDRARIDLGRISRNGLLEVNRQRLGTPLALRTHRVCPTCGGGGKIPSPETVSLNLLRRVEERAAIGGIGGVKIALHPELADALQNGYRQELAALEREFDLRLEIIASTSLHRSQEQLTWVERPAGQTPPAAVAGAAALGVSELTMAPNRRESAARPAGPAEPAEEGGENGKEVRRRRRRGGRRHKKGATQVEAAAEATPGPVTETDREGEPVPAAEPADEAQPSSSKRRRRRGGRRHRPTAKSAEAPVPSEDPE